MQFQVGVGVRTHREKPNLYLRQYVPLIEMDTAKLEIVKKGVKHLKWEQLPIMVELLKVSSDELMKLRLTDQIYAILKD